MIFNLLLTINGLRLSVSEGVPGVRDLRLEWRSGEPLLALKQASPWIHRLAAAAFRRP
jgi:hypothetical protein